MSQINDVLEALNDGADGDLGAVVLALDARGEVDQADAVAACDLGYHFDSEWMDGMSVTPVLSADATAHGQLKPDTLDFVEERCRELNSDWFVQVSSMRLRLRKPGGDWREARQAARDRHDRPVDNQGTYRSVASVRRVDRLNFGSDEEVAFYRALLRKQAALPSESTIGIMPGPGVRVVGRNFWPDFVITYRGRVGIIEVDGPHHHKRAAADHSRDGLLSDAGTTHVERIVVEDTADEVAMDRFIDRFLQRLTR